MALSWLAIGGVLFGLLALRDWHQTRGYEPHRAVVLEAKIIHEEGSVYMRQPASTWVRQVIPKRELRFAYVVDGVRFIDVKKLSDRHGGPPPGAHYERGHVFTLYVDPESPEENSLWRGVDPEVVASAVACAILLLLWGIFVGPGLNRDHGATSKNDR